MRLFRVRGRSMLPTLLDGDFVIGRRLRAGRFRIRQGQVVCVKHPHLGWLIKRLGTIANDQVGLISDGQTGNEHLGNIDIEAVRYIASIAIGKRGMRRIPAPPLTTNTQETT